MDLFENHIFDEELGRINFHINVRARKYIFRLRNEGLEMTLPLGSSVKEVIEVINDMRPQLKRMLNKKKEDNILIQPGYSLAKPHFKLVIKTYQGEKKVMVHSAKDDGIVLLCPETTKFNENNIQLFLKKVIAELMVRKAESVFPPIMTELSNVCNLSYNTLGISKAHTRWGSCSVYKHISLSCFLLLLPEHLMRSVMIHELCHTREMNHGPEFWALMNKFTENKALELREEIKNYRCEL